MKNITPLVLVVLIILVLSSCGSVKVPPGQMKKVTGSKSAAPYAPGQQKKSPATKKKN
jgi:hypothetical protein